MNTRAVGHSSGSPILETSPVQAMWSGAWARRWARRSMRGENAAGSAPVRPPPRPSSSAADEDAGEQHQHAADDDLEGGVEERRVHVAGADPRDRHELDRNHDGRDGGGEPEGV